MSKLRTIISKASYFSAVLYGYVFVFGIFLFFFVLGALGGVGVGFGIGGDVGAIVGGVIGSVLGGMFILAAAHEHIEKTKKENKQVVSPEAPVTFSRADFMQRSDRARSLKQRPARKFWNK